ncbi:MAG: pantetheine-phosphate adenylyltransferase [Campylobacter sp.]|nr:pantetheine-phosphate adenylyltransferase [Campylobacter sp.]
MRKACIYPGTFDPITNGHVDVVKRALRFFDKVIIGVAINESKKPYFSIDERVDMAKLATCELKNVEVIEFSNLLVDFAKEQGISTVIRGLRAVSDFEYELQIGYANASLWDEFETVYLMPTLKNSFISSSIIRSIYHHNGEISHLVPPEILKYLEEKRC